VSGKYGITGSAALKPRPSKVIKDLFDPGTFGELSLSYNTEPAARAYDETADGGLESIKSATYAYAMAKYASASIPEYSALFPTPITDPDDPSATIPYSDGVYATTSDALRHLNIETFLDSYMSSIHSAPNPVRNSKRLNIERISHIPSYSFGPRTTMFSAIQNNLMPHYASHYEMCQMAITNYHSLNFFTASTVPSDSAMIYPWGSAHLQHFYVDTRIVDDRPFTIDFYINPRYTGGEPRSKGNPGNPHGFKAGTILHLSSTFAVSLVSGSGVDQNGEVSGYRIMLQLSHSADVQPSRVDPSIKNGKRVRESSGPYGNLIYLSDDNTLARNNWHHVTIKWDQNLNDRTGSIQIDDHITQFAYPSGNYRSTYEYRSSYLTKDQPGALVIGNYCDVSPGDSGHMRMFVNDTQENKDQGIWPRFSIGSADHESPDGDPVNFSFDHPLNAEIHEFKILDVYLKDEDVADLGKTSLNPQLQGNMLKTVPSYNDEYGTGPNNIKFYITGLFRNTTKQRRQNIGPYYRISDKRFPISPFNHILAASCGALEINLENFVGAICGRRVNSMPAYSIYGMLHPRLYKLTASLGTQHTTSDIEGTEYTDRKYAIQRMYETPSLAKRNLSVLPNDNGRFKPNYIVMASGTSRTTEDSTVGWRRPLVDIGKSPNKYAYNPALAGGTLGILETIMPFGLVTENYVYASNSFGGIDPSIISLKNLIVPEQIDPNLQIDWDTLYYNAQLDVIAPADPEFYPRGAFREDGASIFYPISTFNYHASEYDSSDWASLFPSDYLFVPSALNTRDSIFSTIFNISNLYYGNKILENSLYIHDNSLSGSAGHVSITLRDNGRGGLYRCDSAGPHPEWNNVGNVFYQDGIALVKSPILTLFGKDEFEISFKGEQVTHVKTVNVKLDKGLFNSSSNPQYKMLSASINASDKNTDFVYVDSVNIHDENLNVIMRTNLAQPIKKKVKDSMLIRLKMDF
tara:strand:+ start:74398 stop:77316 length:2919 start_codon:yes stop_codon:yes gene_type:complete